MNKQPRARKRLMDVVVASTNSIRELLALYAGMVLLASLGFAYFEHRTIGESLWWAIVTTTTTGYGDLTPETFAGRLIASAVMLLSILFVLPLLIGYIATALIENRDAFTHEEQEALKAELAAIRSELAQLNARKASQP